MNINSENNEKKEVRVSLLGMGLCAALACVIIYIIRKCFKGEREE